MNCDFKDYLELQFSFTWFWVSLVNKAVVIAAPVWFHIWLLLSKKPKRQKQNVLMLGTCFYVLNSSHI